jgi:hypothetical protein
MTEESKGTDAMVQRLGLGIVTGVALVLTLGGCGHSRHHVVHHRVVHHHVVHHHVVRHH